MKTIVSKMEVKSRQEKGKALTTETLTPKQVAAILHTSEAGLAQMRYRGIGPRFIKIGNRKVLYRWSDIEEFLDANTCQRTDDPRGVA